MRFFKQNYLLLEIVVVFLLSLIPLLWFGEDQMIFGGDSGYPLDYVNYFNQRTFTWITSHNFGNDMSSFMGVLPLHGVQYFLTILKIPYYDIQKVTLVFWFGAVAFSMYLCSRYFFKNPDQWIIRMISVILYSVNFYIFLFWQIGSQTTLSAYAFFPLSFLICFKFINKDLSPFRSALYLNLSYLLFNGGGITGVPLLGPAMVIIVGIIIYQLVVNFDKKFIFDTFKFAFFSFIIFLSLNAYFLFPFLSSFSQQFSTLVSQSGGIDGVIAWTNFISRFDSYVNLFRLQGDNIWYSENVHYPNLFLTNPILIILSFTFVILAYLNLIFKHDKKIKKLLFFLIPLSLMGIFFSAGSHDPLGFVYLLMIEHIPGFAAFRSAYYKFIPLVYFSFALLDGMAIYYLTKTLKLKFKIIIPIAFILFLFTYHLPFFDGKNFLTNYTHKTMISIPDYVREFAKLKLPKDDNYRTLILPPISKRHYIEAYNWNYYGAYPVFPGISEKSFVENNAYLNVNEAELVYRLYDLLRKDNLDEFISEASRLSIKYVLLTSDVLYDLDDAPRELPKSYEDKLSEDKFKLISQNGKWKMYEINSKNINPKVYVFNSLDLYNNNIEKIPFFEENEAQFIKQGVDVFPELNKISIRNELTGLRCVSCELVQERLVLVPVRIVPDSVFYPIKIFLEERSRIKGDSDQVIYFNLGISTKRLNELHALEKSVILKNDKAWLEAVNSIKKNWGDIDKIISRENYILSHASSIKIIREYADFEIENLKRIQKYKIIQGNNDLRIALLKSLTQIIKTREKITTDSLQLTDNEEFVFKPVSLPVNYPLDLELDMGSIPKDDNGNSIRPNAVRIDDKELLNIEDKQKGKSIKLATVNSSFEKISLYFPLQDNQLGTFSNQLLRFPDYEERCLVANIKNFKWNEIYNVKVGEKNTSNKARIYVKKIKRNEVVDSSNIFFEADLSFDVGDKNSLRDVEIRSQENDLAPKIYFCTDLDNRPEMVFADISTRIIYKPLVFLRKNNSSVNLSLPKITYKALNPTEYVINIYGANSPFVLGFSDRFSSFWKFYGGDKALNSKHFILNGYANGWYVDKTGSYQINLRYAQQSIFEIGLKISAISLLVVSFFILINVFFSRR